MLFIVALLFTALFYATPLAQILYDINLFPRLTQLGSFAICMGIGYLICVGIVVATFKFRDALPEDVREWLTEVPRRTGIANLDWWGALIAVAFGAWALLSASWVHMPLAAAAFVGFVELVASKIQLRELEPAREPFVPETIPEEDLTPAVVEETEVETTEPPEVPEGVVIKDYSWQYERYGNVKIAQRCKLAISLERYERFREKNPSRERTPPFDFAEFVTSGITAEVIDMAKYFIEQTKHHHWSPFDEISNVLCFVQHFPYSHDKDTVGIEDYWRYPIETLHDETGDCECKSILAGALLRALGYHVLMLLITNEKGAHVAIAVSGTEGMPAHYDFFMYEGKRFFYCETTVKGWHVGAVPAEYRTEEVEIRVYEV